MFNVTFKQRIITLCCYVTFCFAAITSLNAQVSIGTSNPPDPSAALDVVAINKGALFPRVALTGSTDDITIPNPATGLLIYNTGEAATFSVKGYMYWDGSEWRALNSMTTTAAEASIECGMAYLDPDIVIQGDGAHPIPTGTVLKVPYTVGNGGIYNGDTLYSHPNGNVKAVIFPGQLENGSGFLTFKVSGLPDATQTSPLGIKFPLTSFYAANPAFTHTCDTIHIGVETKSDIKTVALIDNLKINTGDNTIVYAAQLTTPDGKFSVRVCIRQSDTYTFGTNDYHGMNLQIRNNQNHVVVISQNTNWEWTGSGHYTTNALALVPGKWCGDNNSTNGNNADNPTWASWLDGNSGNATSSPVANTESNTKKYNNTARSVYWGDAGVYASGSPERRTYSWTINDGANTKTAYFLYFSTSAMKPGANPNPTTCPNGICTGTKAFLKIDQITAQ